MRGSTGLHLGVVGAVLLSTSTVLAQMPAAPAAPAAPAPPAAAPAAPAPPAAPAAPAAAIPAPAPAAPAAAPPPPVDVAAAPAAAATTAKDDDDFPPGVLGPKMRIGPLIGGGVSARPINIGAFLNYDQMFGFGISYNFFPGLSLKDSSVSAMQIELDARWFPFHGSFFLGAGLGYQSLSATATDGILSLEAKVSSPYITPRLGWLWMWNSGITFGFDLGVVIPVGASTSLTANGVDLLGQLDSSQQNVKDAGDLIGNTPLPDIKLRLGYLF